MSTPPATQPATPAQARSVHAAEHHNLIHDPQVQQLHDLLMHQATQPNTITLEEYERHFRPLFDASMVVQQGVRDAAGIEFVNRFDLYKPTQIIRSTLNPEVLATFPPQLTPTRTIDATAKTAIASGAYAMASQQDPDSPTAIHAFNLLLNAFGEDQLKNLEVVKAQRRLAEEIVAKNGRPTAIAAQPGLPADSAPRVVAEEPVSWSID